MVGMPQSNERLQALIAALPDLIFRFAADGTYLEMHSHDDSLLAVPRDRFLGRRIADVLPDDSAPGVAAQLSAAVAAVAADGMPRSITYDLEVNTAMRAFEARVARISTEEVLAVIPDITELRRAEEKRVADERELERRQADLERASLGRELERASRVEAIGYLAATTAHDVNNLLGAINNYASAIERSAEDQRIRRDAREITDAVARGAELTQRLLRIGRRRAEPRRAESMSELVSGLVDGMRRGLGDGAVVLTVDVDPDDPVIVHGSRSRIEQAVMNLIINAGDATRARGGGVIAVSLERRSADEHHSRPDRLSPGDYAVVAVVDSGGGIPEQVRPRIFEPFFSTKTGDNTGLGLPIVREVAQQHGGGVGIDNVTIGDRIGARIELWIPASPAMVDGDGEDRGAARVLVVDDDRDVLRSTRALLEQLGHSVLEASSAAVAVAELHRGAEVDLLLSDVRMADTGGVELVRAARSLRPGLAVAFMTGFADDLVGAPDLADVPVLVKPYGVDELAAVVAGCARS